MTSLARLRERARVREENPLILTFSLKGEGKRSVIELQMTDLQIALLGGGFTVV
jgi:hypothetical protein